MNNIKEDKDIGSLTAVGELFNKISNKLDSIEQKIDKLEGKISNLEKNLEGNFFSVDYSLQYIVDRFKSEPYLCDPLIQKGDLVEVEIEKEYRHRIVQEVNSEGVVVFENGEVLTVHFEDCKKIGHNPTHRYLVIKDLREDDIEGRAQKRRKIDPDHKPEKQA